MRRTGLVLWHKPNSVPAFARWRSFISLGFPSAQHYYRVLVALCRPFLKPDNSAGCDYYPRVSSRIRGKSGQATLPLLRLAPHGVFRAAPLTRMPGGLLPRLFTLTQHHPAPLSDGRKTCWGLTRDLKVGLDGAGRYIFCDTVRRPGIHVLGAPDFTGHVAFRCSDFPLAKQVSSQRSPATIEKIARSEVEC